MLTCIYYPSLLWFAWVYLNLPGFTWPAIAERQTHCSTTEFDIAWCIPLAEEMQTAISWQSELASKIWLGIGLAWNRVGLG